MTTSNVQYGVPTPISTGNSASSPLPDSSGDGGSDGGEIAGDVIGSIVAAGAVAGGGYYLWNRYQKKHEAQNENSSLGEGSRLDENALQAAGKAPSKPEKAARINAWLEGSQEETPSERLASLPEQERQWRGVTQLKNATDTQLAQAAKSATDEKTLDAVRNHPNAGQQAKLALAVRNLPSVSDNDIEKALKAEALPETASDEEKSAADKKLADVASSAKLHASAETLRSIVNHPNTGPQTFRAFGADHVAQLHGQLKAGATVRYNDVLVATASPHMSDSMLGKFADMEIGSDDAGAKERDLLRAISKNPNAGPLTLQSKRLNLQPIAELADKSELSTDERKTIAGHPYSFDAHLAKAAEGPENSEIATALKNHPNSGPLTKAALAKPSVIIPDRL